MALGHAQAGGGDRGSIQIGRRCVWSIKLESRFAVDRVPNQEESAIARPRQEGYLAPQSHGRRRGQGFRV